MLFSRMNGATLKRRDFHSDRFQCRRSNLGMGPIRIRVIFNGQNSFLNVPSESAPNHEVKNIPRKMRTVERVIRSAKKANAKKLTALKVKNDTKRAFTDVDKQQKVVSLLQKLESRKRAKLMEEMEQLEQLRKENEEQLNHHQEKAEELNQA